MFERARLKLTFFYLLIIMLISSIFSVMIYAGSTNELSRIERVQRIRQQEKSQGLAPSGRIFRIDPEVLEESRSRIRIALIIFNLMILGFSGAAGYFLAGRTLNPIEEMIDEQNKFISGASHELRTPLTALKTSTEVGLREKNLSSAEAKSLLRDNLEEIENLRVLTDKLLRLSQFEKLNGDLPLEVIAVSQILEEAKRRVRTLSKSRSITLDISDSKYKVRAERESLVELMVILFDNAIKYSPKGLTVKVKVEKINNDVAVKITDNGMGISKKNLEHVFERFYRGDKARSKVNANGYGLGLSIAKKIAELYGGSISVQSQEGKGSTFTVLLPNS